MRCLERVTLEARALEEVVLHFDGETGRVLDGRWSTATLVALLASPRTANVTGSNYVIDGGLVKTM